MDWFYEAKEDSVKVEGDERDSVHMPLLVSGLI